MINKSLWSKYHVRTPSEQPLNSGTFVLRPFNADGSVNDQSAVNALRIYALNLAEADMNVAANAINAWLANPKEHPATQHLNVPCGADDARRMSYEP